MIFGGMEWGKDSEAVSGLLARMRAGDGVGAIIFGGFGAGKTTLAKLLAGRSARMVPLDDPRSLPLLQRMDFWEEWGRAANVGGMSAGNVILDDLGAEETVADYGARREAAALWLRTMYRLRGEWRGRLIVTTNYSPEGLAARYGDAVADRLAEMCAPCRLASSSRRGVGVPLPPAEATAENAGGVGSAEAAAPMRGGVGARSVDKIKGGASPWKMVATAWRAV